ncbi:ClpXP protease specificity-enhancing factor SspB [Alphaproteobacteria bacterium]|nr:ClpXP protease specificity-enhancing factor SspB [Alphaproteobacteria bacterium]
MNKVYPEILKKNMINVFKDVLKHIEKKGLKDGHHLYITFNTNDNKVKISDWLKKKYPNEMTIVIQFEYWNFEIENNLFKITLSFNDIKTNLIIPYSSVISFVDPHANFGLRLIDEKDLEKNINNKTKKIKKIKKENLNNVINFNQFKKLR